MNQNNNRTFIDFLLLLTKWKKSIFINLLIVAIISGIISFLLPKWYTSKAVIMPPSQDQNSGGLTSLLNNLPISSLGFNIGGGGSETTFMAILKSTALACNVIDKYDLKNFYSSKTMFETLKNFFSDYNVQLTEENMIEISYEYTDSVKVAEIVNYIIQNLGEISTNLMLERAKKTKKYVEHRYFQNLNDIDSLSSELEIFNKKYGIIEFEGQTKALIQITAEIESKIFIKNSELQAIESTFGDNSPQTKQLQDEFRILKKNYNDLINDKFENNKSPYSSLFLSFEDLPMLTKKYAELYTNYLLQIKLQEYLLPQYEEAKLQVQKNEPSLQIIDKAMVPDYKSKPKRAFIIIGALLIAFILQIIFILFAEHITWLEKNDNDKYQKIIFIKNSFLKSNKQS
jgi:tyrosine-protein kinase Etk/Wzc